MQRPRVKAIHSASRLGNGKIRIGTLQYGVGAEIEDNEAGTIWRLLGSMDGSRTTGQIISEALADDPQLDRGSVEEVVDGLVESGFVEDAATPPPAELSAAEVARYDRNTHYFAWIDTTPRPSPWEVQRRLKNAQVTVLGLGGSGSSVAMGLVAAGIGAVHCADFDTIEETNLTRQLLYGEADVGKPKVETAVARLRGLNRHVEVSGQEIEVSSTDDVVDLMTGRDLLVLCADQPPLQIEHWVNQAALRTGTPWIISAYAGPMLVVGTFLPFATPCYACYEHSEDEKRNAVLGDLELPPGATRQQAVIAPTAALTGHFAALDAIHLLGGLPSQSAGKVIHQNLMLFDHQYILEPPFWPDCPQCGQDSPHRTSTRP